MICTRMYGNILDKYYILLHVFKYLFKSLCSGSCVFMFMMFVIWTVRDAVGQCNRACLDDMQAQPLFPRLYRRECRLAAYIREASNWKAKGLFVFLNHGSPSPGFWHEILYSVCKGVWEIVFLSWIAQQVSVDESPFFLLADSGWLLPNQIYNSRGAEKGLSYW